MPNEVQAGKQRLHELEGGSMVDAAKTASKILAEAGPTKNLPSDFPDSLLGLAAKSLANMKERQQKYNLDPQPVVRATQKHQRARLQQPKKKRA